MSGRKDRSDAKLKNLPGQIQAELRDWLVDEGISYKEAKKRLLEIHGVSTSISALNDFWQTACFAPRFRRAKDVAGELADTLRQAPEVFGEPTIAAISQRAFELAVSKDANVKELATLAKIMGDSARLELQKRQQSLEERRIKILEAKAAAYDKAAETAEDDSLTPEERLAAIRKGLRL